MKTLLQILFALLLCGLQAALLRWAGGGVVTLMLPVACVVYLAIQAGNVEGSLGAAGVGLVLDLSLGTARGLMTSLAVGTFVAVRAVNAAVDVRGRAGFAALTVLATLAMSVAAALLVQVAAPGSAPGLRVLPRMVSEALLTGACSPLVWEGMKRIDGMFRREDAGLLR